jgi:hypothetical protein
MTAAMPRQPVPPAIRLVGLGMTCARAHPTVPPPTGADGVQRVDVEVARFAIDWERWKPLDTVRVRIAGSLPAGR